MKNWQWQQKQWLSQQDKKEPDTAVDDLPEPEPSVEPDSSFETPKNQLDKIRRRMNAFGLAVPVLTSLKSGIERIFLNKDEGNDNEQGQQEGEKNQRQANETVVTTSKPFIRIYSK